MALFEKGHPRLPGAGRQKGRPNNATLNAREAIARLVEGNIDRLQGWLDEVAEKEGALAALRCLLDLLEYHVPKLTRAELTVDKPGDGSYLDARNLSYEDRQALRGILGRYKEATNRDGAASRRDVAPSLDTEDAGNANGTNALNAGGVGDGNDG
jgi:hypothetical protein